jgi:hypothetical protein
MFFLLEVLHQLYLPAKALPQHFLSAAARVLAVAAVRRQQQGSELSLGLEEYPPMD